MRVSRYVNLRVTFYRRVFARGGGDELFLAVKGRSFYGLWFHFEILPFALRSQNAGLT